MKKETKHVAELSKLIGKKGVILVKAMEIDVEILDVKREYGNIRYQVRPITGTGSAWMQDVFQIVK